MRSTNLRHLTGWKRFLEIFFSEWQWARKRIGGKWEAWWVEPCSSFIWHPVTEFSRIHGKPPLSVLKIMRGEENYEK